MRSVYPFKRLCWSMALAVLLAVGLAGVATAAPVIRVSTRVPDHVTPGKKLLMWVSIMNVGDQPLTGNLTLKYTFPAGVTPLDPEGDGGAPSPTCTPSGQVNECIIDATGFPLGRSMRYTLLTSVDPSATGTLTGQVEASGGGASNAVSVPLVFRTDPLGPFDVDSFDVAMTDNPAVPPGQAGGVPTEIDTSAELRSRVITNFDFAPFTTIAPAESFRDVIVHVPPGLVGYPTATAKRCTPRSCLSQATTGAAQVPICPRDSQIGLALSQRLDIVPLYNLEPPLGAPAEFGFFYQSIVVTLRAKVRPSDHGIDIVTEQGAELDPDPEVRGDVVGRADRPLP